MWADCAEHYVREVRGGKRSSGHDSNFRHDGQREEDLPVRDVSKRELPYNVRIPTRLCDSNDEFSGL